MTEKQSTRQILSRNDPSLRAVCRAVQPVDSIQTMQLMDELKRAMAYPAGIGLAAPQLGELVRVIVVCVPNGSDVIEYELANPQIYYTGGASQQDWEGCLSFPTGFRALVRRPRKIKVRAFNRYHEPIQFAASQLVARCLQHEIDHLDGILITDKASRTDQRNTQKERW